ncbi:hypothetical protein KSF78_0003808 [Schistosoma japonicum]|nr:hypothetical protein KSF78_0003808 [Schistosoma japonicum]
MKAFIHLLIQLSIRLCLEYPSKNDRFNIINFTYFSFFFTSNYDFILRHSCQHSISFLFAFSFLLTLLTLSLSFKRNVSNDQYYHFNYLFHSIETTIYIFIHINL